MSAKRHGIIGHWGGSGPRPRIALAIIWYNNRFVVIIPQQQALSGLPAAKRQRNRLCRFWLWCNMRSPLLCSGRRQTAATNGKAVCPAHIIPDRAYSLQDAVSDMILHRNRGRKSLQRFAVFRPENMLYWPYDKCGVWAHAGQE